MVGLLYGRTSEIPNLQRIHDGSSCTCNNEVLLLLEAVLASASTPAAHVDVASKLGTGGVQGGGCVAPLIQQFFEILRKDGSAAVRVRCVSV